MSYCQRPAAGISIEPELIYRLGTPALTLKGGPEELDSILITEVAGDAPVVAGLAETAGTALAFVFSRRLI